MSGKRWWVVSFVVLVLLGALRGWRLHDSEPIYQGKPLSHWLHQAAGGGNPQAWQVLNQIGPDAVPYLLRTAKTNKGLRFRDRTYELRVRLWTKLPSLLQKVVPVPVCTGVLRIAAVGVLDEIAPRVKPPLSDILPLVNDENAIVRAHAFSVVGKLGTAAKSSIPTLIGIVKSTQIEDQARISAAWVLGEIGMEDRIAVAAALSEAIIYHPDPAFRVHGAAALWKVDRQTNAAVQVLSQSLRQLLGSPRSVGPDGQTEGLAAMRAMKVLGQIGPAAHEAVPLLTKAAYHSDFPIRTNSLEALRRMAPEYLNTLRRD
jgi:hypothetical protein